jgi:hypothetical protein
MALPPTPFGCSCTLAYNPPAFADIGAAAKRGVSIIDDAALFPERDGDALLGSVSAPPALDQRPNAAKVTANPQS